MKFNKLILGLAAPLLLASCNNGTMGLVEAQKWVAQHYPDSEEKRDAIATLEWDYHATTGGESLNLVKSVFNELNNEQKEEIGWHTGLFQFIDGQPTIGKRIITSTPCPMPRLSSKDLGNHWGKENVDDDGKSLGTYKETFKVLDNALTISYTRDFTFTEQPVGTVIKNVSLIRTYNTEGYCTGYGFKVGRHYINKDNIMKLKLTLKFTYEDGNL